MDNRIVLLLSRLRERLWVRPLVFCLLSVGGAFAAKQADHFEIGNLAPEIEPESIETLLSIVASSMLVIATFSVASMVSAYASASGSATPRSFPLIVADDVSQNALSAFIGAFIFSIVSLVALKNGYYERGGHFALFVLTIGVFAWVVVTFVRWVDRIARLGRLGTTIDKVEHAARTALEHRRLHPTLGGAAAALGEPPGHPVYATRVGYVRHLDVAALQTCAQTSGARVTVVALPGTFAAPGTALAYVDESGTDDDKIDPSKIRKAFEIGDQRAYDRDPRFGLVALSEIAGRALSPAVNDPGTAIDIVGTLIRLFAIWVRPLEEEEDEPVRCDRVYVPQLSVADMFDDAFTAIARDGASTMEVQVRLQKALRALASLDHAELSASARKHSRAALERARHALTFEADLVAVQDAAAWSATEPEVDAPCPTSVTKTTKRSRTF